MIPSDRDYSREYLGIEKGEKEDLHWDYIRLALASVGDMAIVPLNDYLGKGHEARINQPSTLGKNWKWRVCDGEVTDDLVEKIGRMTKIYKR